MRFHDLAFSSGSRGCMDDGELLELLADLQGDGWQDGVLQCLRSAHTELQSIHAWYCEVPPAAHKQHAAQNCSTHPVSVLLPLSGWLRLCRDARIRLSPQQLQGAFSGDTAQLVELLPQAGAPGGAPFACFLSGLLGLAFWRANAGRGAETATATSVRGARRLRPLPECIGSALRDFVLPLARRDTSQRFRARCVWPAAHPARGTLTSGLRRRCGAPFRSANARRLAQDEEAQVLLRQYRKPLQALFDRLAESGPPEVVGLGLGCRQATDWLEQSGGIGEYHVQLGGSRSGSASSQSLSSFLTVHLARQAFVDSLPLQLREGGYLGSCFAASRQFQEWLVRRAELKYCAVEQSLAARTHGLLQNVIDGRSTEDVLRQVKQTPAVIIFDPRSCTPPPGVSASLLKLFLAIWDQLDMRAISGFSGREQKVFELLLSHLASLVNTFAYYCGSSFSRTEAEAIGLLELQGWSKFVMDGHVCTKSFSARAAYEVFQRVLDSSGTPHIGLDLAEFVQCLLACAFQRTNVARLLLHEKTAHSVFPVDHCLKAFLSSVLPHLRTRNVLDLHLQCAKSAGLQHMLNEKQDAVLQSLTPPNASLEAGLSSRSEAGMSLDAFLTSLEKLGLLRALKIELDLWNPVDDYGLSQGDYSRKVFKSVLTSEDVKQAVVDTVLTFALIDGTPLPCGKGVASVPLSVALLLQTMVRLAAAMYSQIPHLELEQRVATFFGHLLSPELDAGEAVMRHMSAHSPARAGSVVSELAGSQGCTGYTARQHAVWLAVWQDVDLSRLPGFPMWERRVFEVLQACWPELRSIFHFYCKRSNRTGLEQPGQMTLPAFLHWADECMMRTKLFPQARRGSLTIASCCGVAPRGTRCLISRPVGHWSARWPEARCFWMASLRCCGASQAARLAFRPPRGPRMPSALRPS